MIENALLRILEKEFPFSMSTQQHEAALKMCQFILSRDCINTFILQGYAGTGKTTLISSLVRVLLKLKRQVVLMAPTGRAAKVFSQHAGHPAYTIHKIIYRQKKKDDPTVGFSLNHNKFSHTLFLIDEASMISNEGSSHPFFGSGCLLDDLLQFVYSGKDCRMMFVGDTAQLPPVMEDTSPALLPEFFQNYGVAPTWSELTDVMRQSKRSGILHNATQLRCSLMNQEVNEAPRLDLQSYDDIQRMPGGELIEALEDSYDHAGIDQTIIITRSNKRAILYNRGIRASIFGREEGLTAGDVVMIAKNNYFWTEKIQAELGQEDVLPMDFIANGDIATVKRIRNFEDFYGLHFADVTLCFPDYDQLEIDVRVILDALQSESPALSEELSDQLFHGVWEDYAEYPTRKKRMEKLRKDPNYNALQIKYAYAVTCHKAQGGQWERVFVDQGWIPKESVDAGYYRWLYTALTRASQHLYLVNWPEAQTQPPQSAPEKS